MVKSPAAALGFQAVALMLRVGAVAWVTVIVRVAAPGAVTVMVPVLAPPVLVVVFILKDPLPVRFAGVILVTVSHAVLLLVTAHVLLDDTVMVLLLAADGADHAAADKSNLAGCGCWVTVTVRGVTPAPDTVTVAVLATVPVFSVVVSLNDPLPVRPAGVMLFTASHVWLLTTFQDVLDVILTVVEIPAPALGFHEEALIVRVGAAAWVTLIVRVIIPGTATVIVPVLAAPVFVIVFIRNDPLPVRFAGVMLVMVNHAVLLLVTVHVLLDVTFTVLWLASDGAAHADADKSSLAGCAAWVTVIVRAVIPGADTVTVAVLAAVPVFSVVVSLNDPLPVRFTGVILFTASHV